MRATQTGYATLSRAIQDESIDATERGELIALPFLLIVLLLVFRSPIAAAIPLAFGAVTVIASRGILYFLTGWFDIDAFALTVCTMMGLALGVDYALLMVSRFREELAAGTDARRGGPDDPPHRRADDGLRRQHPAALDAGLVLHRARLAARLAGGDAGRWSSCSASLVATVVGPALLTLLGPNVDRWRIGAGAERQRSRLMALVNAALRRPAPVAVADRRRRAAPRGAGAGAEDRARRAPSSCAEDDPAREDAELIDRRDRPRLRSAVPGRRRHRRRADHRRRAARRARPLPATSSRSCPGCRP